MLEMYAHHVSMIYRNLFFKNQKIYVSPYYLMAAKI